LTFGYDTAGNLTTITDTVTRKITLAHDTQNRLTRLTDPMGRTAQYSYDAAGNLVTQTDPSGASIHYSYDAAHQVTQIVGENNNTIVQNIYDTFSRVTAQTNGRGFTTTFAYGVPGPRQTRVTDPRGNSTIHSYDAQFRLIEVTDPLGNTTDVVYDSDNNRTQIIDKNGAVTRFTYDVQGNVTTIIEPSNATTAFTSMQKTTSPVSQMRGDLRQRFSMIPKEISSVARIR
jgi:YD repeat-containing protein